MFRLKWSCNPINTKECDFLYYFRHIEKIILEDKEMFKALLITGPRQVGKTTTLKHLFKETYRYVTLDDITELAIAKEDPKLFFYEPSTTFSH